MKKILLIATGGTIACENTDNGLSPTLSAERLLEYAPQIKGRCELLAVQPFCLDSTNMTPARWADIAALIRDNYDRFDGFVITHGTDTLGYAAAMLSCYISRSKKPIVLTGSMHPMKYEHSDAPKNLSDALLCAINDKAHGVLVCFAGKIIDGRCAVKLRTDSTDAFVSAGKELIGTVDGESIELSETEFDVKPRFSIKADERVCLIKLVPGCPCAVLDVGQEIKAVVIEGFGTGGLPDYGDSGFEKKLAALVARGVYVIMTTQAVYGGSDITLYEVGAKLQEYGVIDAKEMTTEYACMRAMWALANSSGKDKFAALFSAL